MDGGIEPYLKGSRICFDGTSAVNLDSCLVVSIRVALSSGTIRAIIRWTLQWSFQPGQRIGDAPEDTPAQDTPDVHSRQRRPLQIDSAAVAEADELEHRLLCRSARPRPRAAKPVLP